MSDSSNHATYGTMRVKENVVSVVICVHIDPTAQDFLARSLLAFRHNSAVLKEVGIGVEFVLVEWNVGETDLRLEAVLADIPLSGPVCTVVVPETIHNAWTANPRSPLMQFHAKNVGIRRARGEWILAMNADTLLTVEVMEKLAEISRLSADICYLADRWNFPVDFELALGSHGRVPFDDSAIFLKECFLDNGIDYGAPGDFTLMHRDLWKKLGAYFEGVRFSNLHLDTLLCRQAESHGFRVLSLGHVYHVMHEQAYKNSECPGETHHGDDYPWTHVQLPYTNQPNWGMADASQLEDDKIVTLIDAQVPDGIPSRPPEIVPWELFEQKLLASLQVLRKEGRSAFILGAGAEFRHLYSNVPDLLPKLTGYLGERDVPWLEGVPHVGWGDVLDSDIPLVIGSCWWAYALADEARAQGLGDHLLPEFFVNTRCYGFVRD